MKKLPDSPSLAELKWRYYQYRADCMLFGRSPERVGQWFVNRYIKEGAVYTIGTGTLLYYTEDSSLCWRTIRHWLDQHGYYHATPPQVRSFP